MFAQTNPALPYALFALFYLLMLAVWLYAPNRRFLMPILPILVAGMWVEIVHLTKMVRGSWRTAVASVLVASALAGLALLLRIDARKGVSVSAVRPYSLQRRERRELLAPRMSGLQATLRKIVVLCRQ